MSDLIFFEKNKCKINNDIYTCAYGKGGIVMDKVEGDGGTPIGTFPFRQVFYRPDRIPIPKTILPVIPLTPEMGWCDDVADPMYNQLVALPYTGRHELLWRDDHVYDVILVVGYNDDQIIPGKGSAIFIHVMRENYQPTQGCLAFSIPDLCEILSKLSLTSKLIVCG
jgi:L,D-peptidoglycan transpeptidase YkuD (ErfK/YbiS/YcfS/YnhG family)